VTPSVTTQGDINLSDSTGPIILKINQSINQSRYF